MWTAPRALLATAATVKSSVGASAGQGRDGQWAQEHEAFHHEHIGLCQQTKPQHHAKVVGMPEKGLSYHRLHFEWSAHDPKPRSAFRCAETTCPYSGEGLGRSGCRADGVRWCKCTETSKTLAKRQRPCSFQGESIPQLLVQHEDRPGWGALHVGNSLLRPFFLFKVS